MMKVIFITPEHFGHTLKESFWPHQKSGPACLTGGTRIIDRPKICNASDQALLAT